MMSAPDFKKALARINSFKKEKLKGRLLMILVATYFLLISSFMIFNGMWFSPDQFIIAGLVLALFVAQPLAFLRDWIPFVFLFLSYEYLRGLAPKLGMSVHIFPMIHVDQFLARGVLTANLQKILYTPGSLHIYDYFFSILYMLHFVSLLVFAFFLWIKKRHVYKRFVVTTIALAYAGFLTYVLYPAMPPWMASSKGFIPPVANVVSDTFNSFVKTVHFPSLYQFMDPNPVAAMPSLHAAFPMLVYLFMVDIFGKRARPFIIYPVLVWIAIIYTGNHYIIDTIVGILYAYVAFYAVKFIYNRKEGKELAGQEGPGLPRGALPAWEAEGFSLAAGELPSSDAGASGGEARN